MDFSLSKEQKDIQKAAREFALKEFPPRALEFDREEKFDYDIWKRACKQGLVGVFIDAAYGGPGYGFFEHCLINEEFWAVEPGMSEAIEATTFGSELIMLYGTATQKEWLPKLVKGEAIFCTAITEPNAGCDVSSVSTTAVKENGEWVLNGKKVFATNGTVASVVLAFCLTDPENPSRHKRHSFILVPTNTKGFTATKMKGKMGIRASDTAELSLDNVRVPAENLLGKGGNGFAELMEFFNRTRLHICAQGVGLARAALEESINYAKKRKQYGASLASFQATQFKIAEMATKIKAARNLYYEAAVRADQGDVDHRLIAMAKWYSARTAVECADEALQIHGGYGYMDEYRVQRLYRDAKVLELYEGTREVEKIIVASTLL